MQYNKFVHISLIFFFFFLKDVDRNERLFWHKPNRNGACGIEYVPKHLYSIQSQNCLYHMRKDTPKKSWEKRKKMSGYSKTKKKYGMDH